ncbi:putative Transmembrane protein [Seiridium unicorne]|uniref:Transmembrane protein n=1 Tax=Seiridium unicorne TaxID=138068 RepID=A0ABR2UNF3_9PEZI
MQARRILPEEVSLQESQWTFGQILPVLLVVAPVFASVRLFASSFTEEVAVHFITNTATARGPLSTERETEATDEFVLARATQSSSSDIIWEQSKIYPFSAKLSDFPDRLISTQNSEVLWLTPCPLAVFMAFVASTFLILGYTFGYIQGSDQGAETHYTVVILWLEEPGLFETMVIGIPTGLILSIAIGFNLDNWLSYTSGVNKVWAFFLVAC